MARASGVSRSALSSLPELADDLVGHDLLGLLTLRGAEVVHQLGHDLVDDGYRDTHPAKPRERAPLIPVHAVTPTMSPPKKIRLLLDCLRDHLVKVRERVEKVDPGPRA